MRARFGLVFSTRLRFAGRAPTGRSSARRGPARLWCGSSSPGRASRRRGPLIPRIQRIPPITGTSSINRSSMRFEGVSIRSSTSAPRLLGRAGRRSACREPGRPPLGSLISRGRRRSATAARSHRREPRSRSRGFASGRLGTSRTQDASSRRNARVDGRFLPPSIGEWSTPSQTLYTVSTPAISSLQGVSDRSDTTPRTSRWWRRWSSWAPSCASRCRRPTGRHARSAPVSTCGRTTRTRTAVRTGTRMVSTTRPSATSRDARIARCGGASRHDHLGTGAGVLGHRVQLGLESA